MHVQHRKQVEDLTVESREQLQQISVLQEELRAKGEQALSVLSRRHMEELEQLVQQHEEGTAALRVGERSSTRAWRPEMRALRHRRTHEHTCA